MAFGAVVLCAAKMLSGRKSVRRAFGYLFIDGQSGAIGLIFASANQTALQYDNGVIMKNPFQSPTMFVSRHKKLVDRVHTYGAAIFTIVMFTTGGSLKASGLSVLYFIMIGFTNISGGPAWRSRSRSSAPTWPSRTWAPACCSAAWAARSCSWSTAQWPAHQRRRIHARPSRLHAHHLHPRTGNDRSHHDPHPRCLQGRGQEDRQQALGQARR